MNEKYNQFKQSLHKVCKGCKYTSASIFCVLLKYSLYEECPCTVCLVKTMCNDKDKCNLRQSHVIAASGRY